jgi:hypothetical protein
VVFITVDARAVCLVCEKVVGGPIVLGITIEANAAPGIFNTTISDFNSSSPFVQCVTCVRV